MGGEAVRAERGHTAQAEGATTGDQERRAPVVALERLRAAAGNRAVTALVGGDEAVEVEHRPLRVLRSAALEAEAHVAAQHVLAGRMQTVPMSGRAGPAVVQLSPLSTRIDADVKAAGKDAEAKRTLVLHRLRLFGPAANDLHTSEALAKAFKDSPNDLWLAKTLQKHGAEPFWPAEAITKLHDRRKKDPKWKPDVSKSSAVLANVTGTIPKQSGTGTESATLPIEAWYFEGQTAERALVVGGFHGTERAGIEVATRLKDQLLRAAAAPFFTTIVVPTLYPLNAERGRRLVKAGKTPAINEERWVRDAAGNKRSAKPGTGFLDPNRTLPDPKAGLTTSSSGAPVDAVGREMPPETAALVKLIERFKPTRIASVHGVHGTSDAGVFVDPDLAAVQKDPSLGPLAATARPIAFAMALQTAGVPLATALAIARNPAVVAALADPTDQKKRAAALAVLKTAGIDKAAAAERVAGNKLLTAPTTETPPSVTISPVQAAQQGTTLGGYGPVATPGKKPAAFVLTVEIARNVPTDEIKDAKKRADRAAHLEQEAASIGDVFLGKGP